MGLVRERIDHGRPQRKYHFPICGNKNKSHSSSLRHLRAQEHQLRETPGLKSYVTFSLHTHIRIVTELDKTLIRWLFWIKNWILLSTPVLFMQLMFENTSRNLSWESTERYNFCTSSLIQRWFISLCNIKLLIRKSHSFIKDTKINIQSAICGCWSQIREAAALENATSRRSLRGRTTVRSPAYFFLMNHHSTVCVHPFHGQRGTKPQSV